MSDDKKERIMLYVLFFTSLILFMFIGCSVHAEEININSSVYGDTGYSNMYWGQNWYNGSLSSSNFSIGTRYSGRLRNFVLDVHRSFVANTVYTIYVYASTTDFRNTLDEVIIDDITNTDSCSVITYQFISKTKLKTSFACGHNTNRIQVSWYGPEQGYLTGDTNFNINKITLETQSTSGSNNDDIINNATENTQDIINNNNSNTQDIINNQNQNTQEILDSQEDINNSLNTNCKNGPLTINQEDFTSIEKSYLNSSGEISNNNSYSVSKWFIIKPSTSYTINFSSTSSNVSFCWYNSNKQVINCQPYSSSTYTFTTPNHALYFRFSLGGGRNITINGAVCNNWEVESSQDVENAINDLNDVINDTNIDNDIIDSVLGVTFYGNNDLTSIITAPLSILNSLLTNNTCQPLELPFHLDVGDYDNSKSAYLPCGDIMWSRASSTVVTGYRLVVCAFIFFRIGISLYHTLDGFLDPFKDDVEVLDL